MSIRRFKDICHFLHFDYKRTRAYRLKTDHMAAFCYIWDLFLVNCRQKFIPSDCVTTTCAFQREDPASAVYAGQARQVQHKDLLYGLCTPYAIDGIAYLGRQPGADIQKNLGENIVHQLCSGFRYRSQHHH